MTTLTARRPCSFFQRGRCNKDVNCKFLHVIDPTFKRLPCQYFLKGKCHKGKQCGFSHEPGEVNETKGASGEREATLRTPDSVEARLKEFRWKIPRQVANIKPLGYALGTFFQQALELVNGEVGTVQDVITMLASEGGLRRIDELLEQPFNSLSRPQLDVVINKQLLPFLKIFTHTRVVQSVLLRVKVITVYNFIYNGDGTGRRATSLFALLAAHLLTYEISHTDDYDSGIGADVLAMIETILGALSMLVEVNTAAHTENDFIGIAETFAALINDLPEKSSYHLRNAERDLERLQQRLGIGQAMPEAHRTRKHVGPRAAFQLAREMPGELSEQGRRHDNDHANIQDISILPTLQEIQSSRNEYLPVANPRDWHFGGVLGLVDRHFRLLREDTVGQIRDAARIELEKIQNPSGQAGNSLLKRQSARTHVYRNVEVITADFDEYHGAQIVMRLEQIKPPGQQSAAARKEWWSGSRRLGPDSLVCLLNSEGSAAFFVVAMQAQKPTRLQSEYTLSSDSEYAYVVVKPVDHLAITNVLSQVVSGTSYVQQSLVEFPGILLAAFEPTLKAMQRMSDSLDMPFSHILAPMPTHEKEMLVKPPMYATKPGFRFDLSTITCGNRSLSFAPSDNMTEATVQLADNSTLDMGQAEAVISCLARSFAIVQGPPGTGKSYTGVQLIRVALANKTKTKIGPILVCTQTNHALDAILERSFDDGVQNIVRIGGQSKSEKLKEVNLRVLAAQLQLTKTEKTTRWELREKVRGETSEINRLLEAFNSICTQSAIECHLELHHPMHHAQLFKTRDEEGWTRVQRSKGSIVDNWLTANYRSWWRPRSLVELDSINPHDMSIMERRLIFNSWLNEMKEELDQRLSASLSSYIDSKKQLDVVTMELDLRVLHQANIIGVTTSGLARNLELLCGVSSKVLICEEAGEVLEAHLLTALLPPLEHCMLIGDHQQLRPQVQNFDLSSESRSGSQYALDISLFERLVKPKDLFAKPLPLSTLDVQRRMHPSISQLVRETQYPQLKDDPSVFSYPRVSGMRKRLFWMNHEELEDNRADGDMTSRTNSFEANMVMALVKHLSQQGVYKSVDIAVITPYLGQLRKLRKRFSTTHVILLNERDSDELAKDAPSEDDDSLLLPGSDPDAPVKGSLGQSIRLATVDNFQGEEAKVVIVSLVRSNRKNNPGFLKTPNRINVLLSRAQHGMYIFGNMKTTESVPMWHDVMEILRRDDNVGDALELCCPRHQDTPMFVKNPSDFVRLSPEAGCDRLCEKQLRCGHACVAKCHSDMLHKAVYCMKPCMKLKKGCQHVCDKPCGAVCDPQCMVVIQNIQVELGCGHIRTALACYEQQKPYLVVCKEPTKRVAPGCHHEVIVPCHVNFEEDTFTCTATCGALLSCGHFCSRICHQCRSADGEFGKLDHGSCLQKCDRAYSTCSHRCRSTCHEGEPCSPCTTKCDTRCTHARCGKLCSESCSPCLEERCNSGMKCPHNEQCIMPCAAPCSWIPCSERCNEVLSCGCRCPSVCGEECPDAKYCQKHASDEIKAMQADLLMFTSYGDIALDEDPCVFTSCGHIFTIDSLDGTMGMQDYYQVDPLTGKYIKLKSTAAPFSAQGTKPCPECRGSLRNLARYGRMVRRALLDESAKKLTTWSNRKHQDLAIRLAGLEGELMGSADFPRKPNQNISLRGPFDAQLKAVKKLKTTKRYSKMYILIADIAHFRQKLSKEEQPYQVVHDLVEVARRRGNSESITEFEFSSDELQLRDHLQACNLLLRSYLIFFGDVINVHNKTPAGARGTLHVDFSEQRTSCEDLISNATESKSITQEAEAQIHWAKFAAMEHGTSEAIHEDVEPGRLRSLDLLKETAKARLENVLDTCAQRTKSKVNQRIHHERTEISENSAQDTMQLLADEAAEVQRMLRESISSSEMGMVVRAMAQEFTGTGHWYRCANGHLFTVGECGMPMELARCPECGAGVGGQHHQATAGVTHARDIEERFQTMGL
jgi:hypothetical protein